MTEENAKTDTEIIIACAKAMGYSSGEGHGRAPRCPYPVGIRVSEGKKAPHWYSPLHDDGQAMVLVKRFRISIGGLSQCWKVFSMTPVVDADGIDLNRAICECVAKLQMLLEINKARSGTE